MDSRARPILKIADEIEARFDMEIRSSFVALRNSAKTGKMVIHASTGSALNLVDMIQANIGESTAILEARLAKAYAGGKKLAARAAQRKTR